VMMDILEWWEEGQNVELNNHEVEDDITTTQPRKKQKRSNRDNKYSPNNNEIWTINKLFSQKKAVDLLYKEKQEKEKLVAHKPFTKHFRILKFDIRKDYAAMVANILNSGNCNLINDFLVTFGVPNVQLVFQHDPSGSYDPIYILNQRFHTTFCGPRAIACVMAAFPNSAPDYSYQVRSAQIKITADADGSIVASTYEACATYLYEFNIEQYLQAIVVQYRPVDLAAMVPCYEKLVSKNILATPVKRRNPFVFTVQGNCTLKLDEQQRIESIQFTRQSCATSRLVFTSPALARK